jgi:hypothetical protein
MTRELKMLSPIHPSIHSYSPIQQYHRAVVGELLASTSDQPLSAPAAAIIDALAVRLVVAALSSFSGSIFFFLL